MSIDETIQFSQRMEQLPVYLFGMINRMKMEKRRNGDDVIDLGHRSKTIGLDLSGGAHLLAEVRVEEVYEARVEAMWPEIRDMLREETEQLLAQEAERFENAELTWSTLVRHGQPADEILKAAGDLGADLIVMGSHGLGGIKRFLLGSTSDQVMQYASCSVLIVRPDSTGDTDDAMRLQHPLHLLVAYDDSPHARRAAEFCASLPMSEETRITALSVMPLVTLYRQDVQQQLGWMWQEKKKVLEKGLEALASEIAWPTPHVATQVRESAEVSDAILDAADELDIDMIVIGDKGKGAIREFLLGSVTRRIAHHAPCSVLVVRGREA